MPDEQDEREQQEGYEYHESGREFHERFKEAQRTLISYPRDQAYEEAKEFLSRYAAA